VAIHLARVRAHAQVIQHKEQETHMSNQNQANVNPPASTHAQAAALFRRPFAPGAIGFRAMTKVAYHGQPYAGAQVAAYIGAQSVIQRLNAVVPGRWHQQFQTLPGEFSPTGSRRAYLACRLIVSLPAEGGGPDVDAVYEDLGEMDQASLPASKRCTPTRAGAPRSGATSARSWGMASPRPGLEAAVALTMLPTMPLLLVYLLVAAPAPPPAAAR
jgi:hypothetical protein